MNWIKRWLSHSEETGQRRNWLAFLGGILTSLWAFLMLTIFPLYMGDHYRRMGEHKFQFFLTASLFCLLPALVFWLLQAGTDRLRRRQLSKLDLAVLCYLAAVILSWSFSTYKSAGWGGAQGWYTGLRTQLLLVLAYFMVSRQRFLYKPVLTGHFIASTLIFLLGILHRFGVDPLGMYEGLDEKYHLEFLSTMGQATWYSSYVCTVLVLGIAVFYLAKNSRVRIGAGLYCAVGFATVVTQNSDSAFVSMFVIFFALFLFSCKCPDRMERFFETLLLLLGSFKAVGVLQELYPQRAVALDALSSFFSTSVATWGLLLAVALLYMIFLLYRAREEGRNDALHPGQRTFPMGRILSKVAWALLALGLILVVGLIWLNTTGRLGKQIEHSYLLFDAQWGNFRGFTWKFTAEAWRKLGPVQKVFGVGPDCYSAYMYGIVEYADQLHSFFGANQTLTNAHNEFLNTLFCLGLVGLTAYLALLAIGVRRFLSGEATIVALAATLAILSYSAHNFFCYQQVCCTPFLFLLLGMAENKKRGNPVT